MGRRDNPGGAKRLSVGRNMLWNSVGSMVYLACQWLITVLVVRLSSGFDAAGALALGMAVSNIFAPIGQYKIRPFQVSDVNGEYSANQYIAHRILTIGAAVLVMLVYGSATCPTAQLPSVFLYGVYSLGPIFTDVLHGEDQRADRMDIIGISYMLRGLGSIATFALVLWASDSLEMAILAMTVATFLLIVVYDIPQTHRLVGSLRPDFYKAKMIGLFRACAPAVVALFFCSAVPTIPRQVLSTEYGASALGIYASVAAPVLIVQMGAQYVYSPMLTEFARRFHFGSQAGFVSLLIKVTAAISVIALLGIVGFDFVGDVLLRVLYGDEIGQYTYLLSPLVICTVLTAYIWFIGDLLIVMRDMVGNLIAYAIAMGVCAASMTWLISTWGMNGVSFTVILSYGCAIIFALFRIGVALRKRASDDRVL